jgi:hypothetical protein
MQRREKRERKIQRRLKRKRLRRKGSSRSLWKIYRTTPRMDPGR